MIAKGRLEPHESDTFVRFTKTGKDLSAKRSRNNDTRTLLQLYPDREITIREQTI